MIIDNRSIQRILIENSCVTEPGSYQARKLAPDIMFSVSC